MLRKISKLDEIIPNRCAFVLGSEGTGLRKIIKKECDDVLAIPFNTDEKLGIDSLNVSNATSIALYEYYKKYFVNKCGAATRIRTADLMITNQLLYQLSYCGNNLNKHIF